MDLRNGLRRLAFVLVAAAIVGVSSERIFWYWADDPRDHVVVAAVYAPGVAGVLYLIDRYRLRDLRGLLLVAPVLGYLIEGVITPVMYTGGPFVPFFPAWFAFWHGVLGIVVLLVLFRRWLLQGAWRTLLAAATAMGVFWGTWATTMWLPENLEDPELVADQGGPLQVLGPLDFTLYALAFGLILAAGHWLLGRGLWPTSFRPARATRWAWVALTVGVVVAWTVAIPWALPMFAGYTALQLWAMRRHAAGHDDASMLARLAGPIPARALWPLAALPLAAAVTYAAWWQAVPSATFVRVVMYGIIAAQALAGAAMMVATIRRPVVPADDAAGGEGQRPSTIIAV